MTSIKLFLSHSANQDIYSLQFLLRSKLVMHSPVNGLLLYTQNINVNAQFSESQHFDAMPRHWAAVKISVPYHNKIRNWKRDIITMWSRREIGIFIFCKGFFNSFEQVILEICLIKYDSSLQRCYKGMTEGQPPGSNIPVEW